MNEEKCPICEKPILKDEMSARLTSKGCSAIQKASEARCSELRTVPGQIVHLDCRKDYCRQSSINAFNRKRTVDSTDTETPDLRSQDKKFDYKQHCLFCGTGDQFASKKKDFALIPVRSLDFANKVVEASTSWPDEWRLKVKSRIEYVSDLPAADAVYHQVCNVNFRTGKQIPKRFVNDKSVKRVKLGRPQESLQAEAFEKVMDYLQQNDDEQTTINDLIEKMESYLSDTGAVPYGFTHMKQQIEKHFGSKIIITEVNGKKNVVTMWSAASTILHDFYNAPTKQDNAELEKQRIIETAAKLIKNDIKSLHQQKDYYPGYDDMASLDAAIKFVPESLQTFLKELFTTKDASVKIASVGQTIIQSTRPRVLIPPLQLGLAVQLHHQFGSRFLIETLHKHGFCSSYKEVITFERSAAVSQGTRIQDFTENKFIQYIADNVDHNICTLDGFNTFHGMGMIASITPGSFSKIQIPRIKVTTEDISAVGKVNIEHFIPERDGLQRLIYHELNDRSNSKDPTHKADVLWYISRPLKTPCPSWSGMMQLIHKGQFPGESSFLFLPMIDINPGDSTCLYSTLRYISSHAHAHKVTPIVTFDQPLWFKAVTMQASASVDNDISSIVVNLGGFHTLMSFLGAIGHIMAGSGLEELLECIYAGTSVTHMLSGKAVSRAIRGHTLVSGALYSMILAQAFGVPSTQCNSTSDTTNESQSLLDSAAEVYDEVMSGSIQAETLEDSDVLEAISQKLRAEKQSMQSRRTARLWLQYLDMVQILLTFIKAERTGNWSLHLSMMQKMMPYLAAAGHNNYTKSLYLHLQRMDTLNESHPDVCAHFRNGLHVIRRSKRYWAGLSPDLVIEQVLMRSVKTTGGLTRGRGMNESQRLVWLLSAPSCAQINMAMQEFTTVSSSSSEQHKEMSEPRKERDMKDTQQLLTFLSQRSPFDDNPSLRSIVTGVDENRSANVDSAQEIGKSILNEMMGKTVAQHTFRKKDQVRTLGSKGAVRVQDDDIYIDPKLLFQRLVTAGKFTDNLSEVFQYELCSYPPALFANRCTPRAANKAILSDALWKFMPKDVPEPTDEAQYILDGGALLHRIPWKQGSTYNEICKQYCNYVLLHYGTPTIVFDGYENGPNTKDATHRRRAGTSTAATVHFSGTHVFKGKKEEFFQNSGNKQRFITLLREHLEQYDCTTDQAVADADLLIVETTVAAAQGTETPTILVGDDTDLLILLCHHTPASTSNIFFRPEHKSGTKHPPRCWNITVLKGVLGSGVVDNILFIHAILGCDTTSALYGIGKGAALKLACSSSHFREMAQVFRNQASTKDEIITAGETALVLLYKGPPGDILDNLRLQTFHKKVIVSKSFVDPQVLPPTSSAAEFHSMRVYLQVQEWMGFSHLKAEEWGWKLQDEYYPVLTNKQVAPKELLEMVRCNCKTDCSTKRCICRKNNLECSSACGQCHGICSNMIPVTDDEYADDTDDEGM